MKATLDCIPCIGKQALRAARAAGADEDTQRLAIELALDRVKGVPLTKTPAEHSMVAYEVVWELTGNRDPFREEKRKYNELALKLFPRMKELVAEAEDKLYEAIKIAIAGNIVDLGIGMSFDLEETLEEAVNTPLAVDHYEDFKAHFEAAKRVLYIGDNAGEIVFDKVLLEEILREGKEVIFVVRGGPIINDITREDAEFVGISKLVPVITTGGPTIGVFFDVAGEDFLREFERADMIIAKGQGNFETLDEVDAEIFFMLKAKCDVIAERMGVKFGEVGLIYSRRLQKKLAVQKLG